MRRKPLHDINSGFPTLGSQLTRSYKKPVMGVTHGGSSRINSPAKVAATNGLQKKPKPFLWEKDE